jgi:hypothetical protein
MRFILVTILAAGAMAALPFAGGVWMDEAEAPRVTVIYKNLASPTLEELGQKAGDPSTAGAPDALPVFAPRAREQWI